ncbi:hypothetical protein ACP93_10115 [Xanthomonas sp. NCPPB 1128]|uniref:XAC0095 family protein n=1 Tax=Xanthomonas sp. NCPPB 1128 TaxID=1775876 RepID=UPI00065AD15C|nr:hypothetical protein [Xanthomonas sp. NCPPB 1128]KMM75633.1 hypothetical protein ACP93_10115 [Xanthomonas sp. NCPPB 1128]
MAHDRLDDDDMPGYFLPEDSQFRLAKLRDHVRFLVRLAQPRTQAEERAAEPKVRMSELALCLELLAEQVELVLGAMSYPAQRTDTMRDAWSDATVQAAPDAGSGTFRVTQQQIDRLTQLAEIVSANAQVLTVADGSEHAGQALPQASEVLCNAANAMRALLERIERQPLHDVAPNVVREERAVYELEPAASAADCGWLH